jgi:YHS domain-containing protein
MLEHHGVVYHFCGRRCMEELEAEPEKFAQAQAQSA